jgi:hypothetical protein
MNDEDIVEKLLSDYKKTDTVISNYDTFLKFVIYENFGDKMHSLYSLINDNDVFFKIIDFMGGSTVEIPTSEEFKSTVILAMIYYYKEVMHYTWREIEKLIPYEKDLSLRYGSKLRNVKRTVKRKLNESPKSDSSIFEI